MLSLVTRMPRLTPRKLPKQERSRALVAAMHEATRRTLIKEGYAATTVVEIARVAGVSPGSVYQYYPTKESIISGLHVAIAQDAVAYMADNLLEVRDAPLDEVAAVIAAVTLQLVQDEREVLVVLAEAAKEIGTMRKVEPIRAEGVQLLSAFLASRDDVKRESDLCGWVLSTTLQSLTEEALHLRPALLDDERFFDELRALTLRYIRG